MWLRYCCVLSIIGGASAATQPLIRTVMQRSGASVSLGASNKPTTFSAAAWHRQRRREMLAAHPEVRKLISESDTWVAAMGALILPSFAWAVCHSPDMSGPEWCVSIATIGSMRANWAIYCGHAISHGRWRGLVGAFGTARYNAILASVNLGHLFQVVPSYWLLHHSHHTKLGSLPLLEARERARRGRQTDGDLGIATRLFSPPARKYSLIVDRDGTVLPRQSEVLHQALSVLVHAIAPVAFAGYAVAALRADNGTDRALQTSLVAQALASLAGYLAIVGVCMVEGSWSPLVFTLASSLYWLSPLNVNWVWTCPHVCQAGAVRGSDGWNDNSEGEGAEPLQPTVSFYTPNNIFGHLLDVYMGFENYHCEHHDFPDVPMYRLPQLRALCPEYYDDLRAMPLAEVSTWRILLTGDFFYACQDATLQAQEH